MKHHLALFILPLFSGLKYLAYSQPIPANLDLNQLIETIYPNTQSEIEFEELHEQLLEFLLNPIDLNNTSTEELRSLHLLSEFQIDQFFQHIQNYGPIISLYELQVIPGFEIAVIKRLLPFVSIDPDSYVRPFSKRFKNLPIHYLLIKHRRFLQKKAGFQRIDPTGYRGSPDQLLIRYTARNPGLFSGGFTLEKDPGEQIRWNRKYDQRFFDFFSAHLSLQKLGKIKHIILGDYKISKGQGLLLANGFRPFKGGETISSVRKANLGVRPYSSVTESSFFRGGAITVGNRYWDLTGFYSRFKQDGKIQLDARGKPYFHSFSESGNHRTLSELESRNSIKEQTFGLNLDKNFDQGKGYWGVIFLVNHFDKLKKRKDNPESLFDFDGKLNHNLGIYYSWQWRNFNLFGEAARSKSGGIGMVGGILANLSSRVELALLWRDYGTKFHSFYGQAYGERSSNRNEQGIYWGIRFSPIQKLVIRSYYDLFSFKWSTNNMDGPSHGYEAGIQLFSQLKKYTSLSISTRIEQKEKKGNDSALLPYPISPRKFRLKVVLNHQVNLSINLTTRINWNSLAQPNHQSSGFGVSQDLSIKSAKWEFTGRMALFDAEDFENRIYSYEKNVPHSYSFPAYSGRGVRSFLLIRYKLSPKISIWIRYANSSFRDRSDIGTGLEKIQGNKRTDLTTQMKINL